MFLFKTMKTRLMSFSSIIAFVIIVALTSILYITTRAQMLEETINIVSLEVERESVSIEREFSKIYEVTQSLQLTASNLVDTATISNPRDYLITLSGKIVEENPNIIGINLIFEPDILEDDADNIGDDRYQFDGQFITYVSRQSNDVKAEYIDNYEDYEMYYRAILIKDDFFTEPYYFNVEGQDLLLSTVVFPIVKNGEYIGLVGVDFTADYIFEHMKDFHNTFPRRDIIVSQQGIILLNSDDETTFGDHISTIHPLYFTGIAVVDLEGKKVGTMPNGNIEVLYSIALGSSGEHWYIFSDVPSGLINADINQSTYIMISISLVLLAIYLVGLYFINSATTQPVTDFTQILSNFDISTDDVSQFDFNTRGLEDLELLKQKFIESITMVKQDLESKKIQNDFQELQLSLRTVIQSATTLPQLSDLLIHNICTQTDSILGALFIYKDDEVKLSGKYGLTAFSKETYQLGEGIVGEVARQQQYQIINHHEAFEPIIDYGVTQSNPPYLLVYPFVMEDKLFGVVEIVSVTSIEEQLISYLDKMSRIICTSIERQNTIEQTNVLYEQTKTLARNLELQQEELRIKNEELESQQEELRVTNEELETQQEELRVTNKELQFNLNQIGVINKELEITKEELQSRTNEAEMSNKYKSEFLTNMSHELRTPLNSILILSNLILENDQSSLKSKDYASTIHSAGKDLLELINGILDLSKIEAGKEEIHIDDWDINTTFNEIYDRYSVLAKEKNLALDINLPPQKINIKTDVTKAKLVLTNLISNAIKFTSQGSITVNVIDNKREVEFHVVDTGIGIKPENIDIIFKEFKQIETDNKRSYSGTGLGLALCKNYAVMLKGRITVQSVYGRGSTFSLILPKEAFAVGETLSLKRSEHKPTVSTASPVDEGIISDDRHRINTNDVSVLVIDDDSSVLQSLRDYFNQQNIFVIVAETGENGLFLADYFLPNLIIVDIKLPRMSGQDISQKLLLNPRTKDIPIITISNSDKPKDLNDIPFYRKPLTQETMDEFVPYIAKKTQHAMRILLVEDDQTHSDAVVEYIHSKKDITDLVIDTCSSKKETLELLKQNLYSLLVVDLGLADAHDFELVEDIRKNKAFEKIPVIVYTGKHFTPVEEEKLLSMVNDIIIKADRSPERLINNIRLFLAGYEKQNVMIDQAIFKDKTVMIVDDDIRNIFALTGLLETYNIRVMFETSGQKALEKLQGKEKPDLILMDIMMPEMDGYETISHIREMKEFIAIPIIALTAKTMRGDREKCIESGATEYLSKPLNKDKLLSVLRVWLQ